MTDTDKFRIGVCGTGNLGRMHLGGLAQRPDVTVAAICDIRPDAMAKAQEVLTRAGSSAKPCRFTELREMLREPLDAVLIVTPTDLHARQSVLALRAGCAVFCEKPMALSLRDCDRIIAARDHAKRQLMIGQCLRFWPEYQALRQAVQSGEYGRLRALTMTRVGAFPDASVNAWMGNGRRSGGALLDLHLHDADWAQDVFGPPRALCAAGLTGPSDAIDEVSAIWRYADFQVTLRGSWLHQTFSMTWQAVFEHAALEFGTRPEGGLCLRRAGAAAWEPVPPPAGPDGYAAEMTYFLDCVRGRETNTRCTAESTRQTLALLLLEKEAVRRQTWIRPGRL